MVNRIPSRMHGFTLLELMVVVVILMIAASIAVPSFSKMIGSMRQKGTSAELFSDIVRARSEAIRLNRSVTVTPVTSGSWHAGWSIMSPITSTPLSTHGAIVNTTITGPASLTYLSNGRVQGTATINFSISTTDVPTGRCIAIDLSGRPYQKSTAC